ncbi:MAG: hypothetical protein ACRDP6_10455 [Actinoallomurus sp.]
MEPLQVISLMVASDAARNHALSALPDAPRVPYEPRDERTPIVRSHLAGLLRRTADRVDPCPALSAG